MSRARFLSAVLRPFPGDSELETAARRSLEEKLDKTDPDAPLLDEAAARFEAADARSPKLGRVLRWGLLVGAVATVFWPTVIKTEWQMGYAARIVDRVTSIPFTFSPVPFTAKEREDYIDFLFPGVTPEQKLLLSSDSTASAEALWKEHFPDDPAIYYHYVRRHLIKPGGLPADFLATAEKLDPDNGYPAMLMAGTLAGKTVKRELLPGRSPDRSRPSIEYPLKTYTVQDEEKFRKVLDLFARAASKTEFESRKPEICRRCLENLAPPDGGATFTGEFARWGWLGLGITTSGEILSFRPVNYIISARAAQLEAAGDQEGLADLARQWLDFMPRAVGSESFLIDCLVWKSCIQSTGRQLLKSCRALGLEDEARRLEGPVVVVCEQYDAKRQIAAKDSKPVVLRAGIVGSQLLCGFLNATGNALEIDSMDLTANRLASYTLLEWLAAHLWVGILMVCAGISALGWFRWGSLGRLMGKRMSVAITPVDWMWILALGVFAPIAWHLIATRVPAFHARDIFWRAQVVDELPVSELPSSATIILSVFLTNSIGLLQCISTLFFIVMSVVWIAGRRVAMRGRVLGFGRRRLSKWFGWTGPLAAALALPACALPAIVFESGEIPESRHLLPAAILLGYAALWLLVVFGRAILGHPSRGLERATVARALVPAFLCAAIAVGVAGRFAAAEHRHWFVLDSFGVAEPQYGGVTKYEYRTTRWLQEKLLSSFRSE